MKTAQIKSVHNMILDFIGFGGTGKTTFINQLYDSLKKEGCNVEIYDRPSFNNPKSIFRWSTKIIFNPIVLIEAYKLLQLINKENHGRNDFTYIETLKRISLYSEKRNHSKNNIILSDEGISIYLQHLKLQGVDSTLKSLLPEYLISLHVSEKERLSRVFKRGGEVARRKIYEDDERLDVLISHFHIFIYHGDSNDKILSHFLNLNEHSFSPKMSEVDLELFINKQTRILSKEQIEIVETLEYIKHQTHLNYINSMNNYGVQTRRYDVSYLENTETAVKALTKELLEKYN